MKPIWVRVLTAAMALATAALLLTPQVAAVADLPERLIMRAGGVEALPSSSVLSATIADSQNGVAALASNKTDGGLELKAGGRGETQLTYRLLGLVPVRTVSVSVEPEKRLIPGGQSVGVAIDTAGVMVVGASDLGNTPSPARVAGIKSGDIIRNIDGKPVSDAESLSSQITSGETVTLDIVRSGKAEARRITPALDERDGCWRLGVWVRDSTAGVGTLTFYDPQTGGYGALGHAITDSDTRVSMPVGQGGLYSNRVVDVTPSKRGQPGELTGDFVFDARSIGTVELNTEQGIFGRLDDGEIGGGLYPSGLPAASLREIHEGAATLLTTVDGSGVREYACEIERINDRAQGARTMVVRVTDPALLEKTGGIVQGMSGSPILQDGMLIGAVTHVMVNDPTTGYGISIEEMLASEARMEESHTSGPQMAA